MPADTDGGHRAERVVRTTGADFSYNVGRVAAAVGTVFFVLFSPVRDLRLALLSVAFLFLPTVFVALLCRA
jgi:hypothetical protein